jgi:hypothetical protein
MREGKMTEAEQLAAVRKQIEQCLSPKVQLSVDLESIGSKGCAKFYPSDDGGYELWVNVRNPAKAAQARLDELKERRGWSKKALNPNTHEGKELARLQAAMAAAKSGHPAIDIVPVKFPNASLTVRL